MTTALVGDLSAPGTIRATAMTIDAMDLGPTYTGTHSTIRTDGTDTDAGAGTSISIGGRRDTSIGMVRSTTRQISGRRRLRVPESL